MVEMGRKKLILTQFTVGILSIWYGPIALIHANRLDVLSKQCKQSTKESSKKKKKKKKMQGSKQKPTKTTTELHLQMLLGHSLNRVLPHSFFCLRFSCCFFDFKTFFYQMQQFNCQSGFIAKERKIISLFKKQSKNYAIITVIFVNK